MFTPQICPNCNGLAFDDGQVEEIALLNTTLIKWDGSRVLYPNYKMNTDMIVNINRSNNKGELFTCNIDIGTPLSVFEEMTRLIQLHSDASPDINAVAVNPGNGGNPLKFTLVVWWEYTFNSKFAARLVIWTTACSFTGLHSINCSVQKHYLPHRNMSDASLCEVMLYALLSTSKHWFDTAICMTLLRKLSRRV